MKRILSFILVFMLILSMAACKPKEVSKDSGNTVDQGNNGTKEEDKEPVGPNIVERSKGITYRDFVGATPATLNGHDTTVADAGFITNRTEIGFYGINANEAQDGFEFTCELAAEFPVDVTTKYAGDPKYGIPADAKENYAYSIKLNPNAKWENGTPITADDYMYSYEQLINPKMKNVRASEIYTGDLTIANAEAYYKQGKAYEDIAGNDKVKDIPESQYLVTMTEPIYFFGNKAAKSEYDASPEKFKSADGRDLYALYSKETYVPFTEQAKKDLNEIAAKFGDNNPEAWKEFCKVQTENPAVDFSNVGMKKISDYEIEFILSAPTNDFFMKYVLNGTWLVYKDLYESNKQDTGVIKTSYGNDNTKYMAYGPYKITEYIKDKLVVLSMNENWYGWTDGKHEYMSNYEKRRFEVIPEHEIQFQKFLKGELDRVPVGTKTEYAASDYLFSSPDIYTFSLNFHVNKDVLKTFESPGINKTIIAYKEYREALSYGINRVNFVKARSVLQKPLSTIINYTYISDPESGLSYRNSEYGKQVMMDVYGGTDVDSGYDLAKARGLMVKAYEEAKANGDYKDGDMIVLSWPNATETEALKAVQNIVVNSVEEIAKGTPLEGKFKIETLLTDQWSTKMQTGEGQINYSGGGGGAFDPYGLMEFNISPNKTYGIDYSKVNATINIDGKDVTDSCVAWIDRICNKDLRIADSSLKSMILSKVEIAVLKEFASLPMRESSIDELRSKRTKMQLNKYIPLVFFGETYFTMTDAQWDEHVKQQGGEIDYK